MSAVELLRQALASVETNAEYTEAVVTLRDGGRLCFCHRVGERWVRAVGPGGAEGEPGLAGQVLALIALFRLNAKHLEVEFADGGRWEARFRAPGAGGGLCQSATD
jgi:hypothetical protein